MLITFFLRDPAWEVYIRMVTIKQIAERAGVSTATVSNVIHGKAHKVSAETPEQIQKLMDEMGYVQEKRQGVIRCEESKLVAAIIHCHHRFENTILADPFYSIIEQELRRQGCYMMLYVSPHVEEISRMSLTCEVDGVIALSCSKENCKKLYNMIHKAYIAVQELVATLRDPGYQPKSHKLPVTLVSRQSV